MHQLYLVQEANQWIWVNDWYQPMSPEFSSQLTAEHWHQEIAQCMTRSAQTQSKLPRLCQAQYFGKVKQH